MYNSEKEVVVFYDNWCPLCLKIKHNLEKLDIQNSLKFTGIRKNSKLPFPLEAMQKEMFVYSQGHYYHGFASFQILTHRLVLLRPIEPLFYLFNFFGIGSKVYTFIAKRRTIVPVGHCQNNQCEISK